MHCSILLCYQHTTLNNQIIYLKAFIIGNIYIFTAREKFPFNEWYQKFIIKTNPNQSIYLSIYHFFIEIFYLIIKKPYVVII
jgi:hypothetical protein